MPNKSSAYLLNVELSNLMFLKTYTHFLLYKQPGC